MQNLEAVARHWAGASRYSAGEEESREDLLALGIDGETLDALDEEEEEGEEPFAVLEENRETLRLFLSVATQWRIGPLGGVLGLDYAAVDVHLHRMRLEPTPQEWVGLQVMERAARDELNKGTTR